MTNDSKAPGRLGEALVVVIIFLGVAGITFWQIATSFAEQGADSGGPFDNAAMFPRLIAWCLILLSAVQLCSLLLSANRSNGAARADQEGGPGRLETSPTPTTIITDTHLTWRALGCLVVFVLYLATVTIVGYVLATPLMLTAMFLLLGAPPLMSIGVAIAATLTLDFVFNTVLSVVLPVGRLGLPTLF